MVLGFSWSEYSDGDVLSVPLGRDTGLIVVRRADIWDSPYGKAGRMCCSELCDCSDSFLLAPLGPNYIRVHPVFLSWDGYSKQGWAIERCHTHGGKDIDILLFL